MLPPAGHPVRKLVDAAKVPVVELSPAYPENTRWGRQPSDAEATGKIAADYLRWAYTAMGLLEGMIAGSVAPGTVRTFRPGGVIERKSSLTDAPRSRPRILLAFHWYSEALHEGALRHCVEHDREACVVNGDNVGEFPPGSFDGVLGMLPPEDHPVHRLVAQSGVPVVELSPSYPKNKHWVRSPSDGTLVGRMAADYLRRRPVRSFVFVSYCPWPTHDGRWNDFRARLAGDARPCVRFNTGTPGDARLGIRLDKGDPDPNATARLAEFLKGLPRPVGIFGSVDNSARQALEAALQAGLRVPEDAHVIGFGNRDHICRTAPVPVTSVAIDYSDWGYAAAGMLDALMAGRLAPGTVVPFPPSGIVDRASTGGESGGDPLCEKAHALMRDHLSEHLTVTELAGKLGVSKPTLERAFAAAYGEGVARRYLTLRMEIAKAMLAAGDKSESVAAGNGGPFFP